VDTASKDLNASATRGAAFNDLIASANIPPSWNVETILLVDSIIPFNASLSVTATIHVIASAFYPMLLQVTLQFSIYHHPAI